MREPFRKYAAGHRVDLRRSWHEPRRRPILRIEEAYTMQVIYHKDVAHQPFPGGATYQTLVGDEAGSTPVRLGIQTSEPGYETPYHSHPYIEILTIVAGTGE